MTSTIAKSILAFGLATGLASTALAETQGVSDTEVVIGSNADLSGPFAGFSVPAMKAAQQVFDEVNAKGGVHGRKIKLIVEDHGYQVPKAMQAFNKLINSDKIFVSFMTLGTPINIAGFKLQEPKGIVNFLPLSAARQMVEEPIALRFTGFSSYYDQTRAAVKYLAKEKGAKEVCAMYLPTDFGQEMQEGAKKGAEEAGITFRAETTHKVDEADFIGSLTKLKEEGCDMIGVALGIRQVITVLGTAKKMGWNDVAIFGTSASFHTAIAKVPGGVTDGFYAAAGWSDLEARMDNPAVKSFVEGYKTAFKEDPGTGALLGRSAAETFVKALDAAGKDLTSESFVKALESLKFRDEIADVDVDFTATDHQGGNAILISKIEGGSWKEISRE